MASRPSFSVLWSPHEGDKFVAGSTTLSLYKIVSDEESKSSVASSENPTSSTDGAGNAHRRGRTPWRSGESFELLDSISSNFHANCLAWGLKKGDPNLMASGLQSGKVTLFRFFEGDSVIKQFIPRYARACNAIAFNPLNKNQIAAGLDRVPYDCCTLVWDITQSGHRGDKREELLGPGGTRDEDFAFNTQYSGKAITEPLGKVSHSEATASVAWLPNDAFSLAVGTGFKFLRIFDLRTAKQGSNATQLDNNEGSNGGQLSVIAHTKSVLGVKFDPTANHRLLTYSEDNVIKLWDVRMLRKKGVPLASVTVRSPGSKSLRAQPLLQVDWSPTKPGLMATISKGDDCVRLWDFSDLGADLSPSAMSKEASASEPMKAKGSSPAGLSTNQMNNVLGSLEAVPCRSHNTRDFYPSGISWHPTHKQRLLAASIEGTVRDIQVHDAIPIAWGGAGEDSISFGCDNLRYTFEDLGLSGVEQVVDDISFVMRNRVNKGYGIEIQQNMDVLSALERNISKSARQVSGVEPLKVGSESSNAGRDKNVFGLSERQLRLVLKLKELKAAWGWMRHRQKSNTVNNFSESGNTKHGSSVPSSQEFSINNTYAGVMSLFPDEMFEASKHLDKTIHTYPSANEPRSTASAGKLNKQHPPPTVAAGIWSSSSNSSAGNSLMLSAFTVYTSPQRSKALRMCGWWNATFESGSSKKNIRTASTRKQSSKSAGAIRNNNGSTSDVELVNLENALKNLEGRGDRERAVALSLFHLGLHRALEALDVPAEEEDEFSVQSTGSAQRRQHLAMVAMSLSGYCSALEAGLRGATAASSGRKKGAESVEEKVRSSLQLWKNTYDKTLKHQLKQPYLRAALNFLASGGAALAGSNVIEVYRAVLIENGIELRERVAFACRFLPDLELAKYLRDVSFRCLRLGALPGLLLTGLNSGNGVEMLSAYVTRTSDVQTAALLSAHVLSVLPPLQASTREEKNDQQRLNEVQKTLTKFYKIYCALLNDWGLFMQRAKLDVARSMLVSQYALAGTQSQKKIQKAKQVRHQVHAAVPPQVFVRCQYCGSSLSRPLMFKDERKKAGGKNKAPKAGFSSFGSHIGQKASSAAKAALQHGGQVRGCPKCKKPLARCSVCLLPFSCALPSPDVSRSTTNRFNTKSPQQREEEERRRKESQKGDASGVQEFSQWFTWCQRCRHGGHASHLAQWFSSHQTCPVTECQCTCMLLDSPASSRQLASAVTGPTRL